MNSADHRNLWKKLMDFRVRECVAFWSFYSVVFHYGTLCLFHQDDDTPYLKQANVEKFSFEEVHNNTEHVSEKLGRPMAFYVTPAWQGDRQGFQDYLSMNGYTLSSEFIWLRWEKFDLSSSSKEHDFEIKSVPSFKHVETMMIECFEMGQSFCDFAHENMIGYDGQDLELQFFGAFDKDILIGMVGVTWDRMASIAHVHCLGVIDAYRRKGVAKSLVLAATQHVDTLGVGDVFVNVNSKNKASLAVQNACGYCVYGTAKVWKK